MNILTKPLADNGSLLNLIISCPDYKLCNLCKFISQKDSNTFRNKTVIVIFKCTVLMQS